MIDITKKTFENNDIEVIIDGVNTLRLNENHTGITKKYDKIYKKHRHELVDEPVKQPDRRFLRIDLALKIIMDC